MHATLRSQPESKSQFAGLGWRPASDEMESAFDALSHLGIVLRHRAGEEIFGEGEQADYVYQVVDGAVRTYRILGDGRRQVCEFHLPGEFIGLETGIDYRVSAEGMTDVTVVAVRRSALANLASTDVAFAGRLWELAIAGMHRSQNHASILGRLGAIERVAAFLVDFAARVGARDTMELPMTRQDIADYLGLTIHTVSRTLSQLQSLGFIDARSSRQVHLRRQDALADLCG
jgi:CRP/FNR family transcriptional regulator, nitrogen fixation regulation protein